MEKNKKMMKKLISLLCCLLPFGAGADMVYPNSGANVSTDDSAWTDAISANQSLAISTIAAGSTSPVVGIVSDNGFAVNALFAGVQSDAGAPLSLYILNTANNPFAIVAKNDVSINSVLRVIDGFALNFKTQSGVDGAPFNLTIGNGATSDGVLIGNNAKLDVQDIVDLTINGNIVSNGRFTAKADNVTAKSVNIESGILYIDATNGVDIADLTIAGNNATDSATVLSGVDGISVDNIQSDVAGIVTLASDGGTINVAQNLQNNGGQLQVTQGNLVVGGGIFNASDGVMTIGGTNGVGALTVSGGALKNNGDLYVNVTGQVNLAGGLDLSDAAAASVVQINAGGLNLGTANSIVNNLNNTDVVVTDSNFNVGTISNGENGNSLANLSVQVTKNMTVDDLSNAYGVLDVDADNITINDSFDTGANAITTVDAVTALVVSAPVNNAGNMDLGAKTVTVAGVQNTGTLDITTPTDTGSVMLTGAITNNSGTTSIVANTVSANTAGGIYNRTGTSSINANSVTLGAIDVSGGVVKMNVAGGRFAVLGDVVVGALQDGNYVAGGQLDLASNVSDVDAGGAIVVSGDFNMTDNLNNQAGNLNVARVGTDAIDFQSASMRVMGDFNVISSDDTARQVQIKSDSLDVANAFVADGKNANVLLGDSITDSVDVGGFFSIKNQATVESYAADVSVGTMSVNGSYIAHGNSLTATDGGISVTGDIDFDGANAETGISINGVNEFIISANAGDADIVANNVSVGGGNKLVVNVADDITVLDVLNRGTLSVDAGDTFVMQSVNNLGTADFVADDIWLGNAENTGVLDVSVTGMVLADSVNNSGNINLNAKSFSVSENILNTAGKMDVTADLVAANSLQVSGGVVGVNADTVSLRGAIDVDGDLYNGGTGGMLNVNASVINAKTLDVAGDFVADAGVAKYDISENVTIAQNLENFAGVTFDVDGTFAVANNVINEGNLDISANGVKIKNMQNSSGFTTINSGSGVFDLETLAMNGGNLVLKGSAMNLAGAINTNSMLYQNYNDDLFVNDINVLANEYTITTSNFAVGGINQRGRMIVNSSDIFVNGSVDAHDLRFVADDSRNWMNVDIRGDVSNGVDFIGLEKMSISGNYVFGADSMINAAVLPYAIGSTVDSTDVNYWATVSMADENTPSQIVKPIDAAPMISVAGVFTGGVAYNDNVTNGAALANGNIGIELYDAVNSGTAIWLLHANGGIQDMGQIEKLRNLNVMFCNADGSLCYDYMESLNGHNSSDEDLPAYVSVRDDDLFVVFDPRFGGPVLLQNDSVQQIVARDINHTDAEFVAAGALDNMIVGRAYDKKFYNKTPIEVIPLIFDGTNMETLANELYNRLENYNIDRNATPLANFSRLNQMREVEQAAGAIVLNEHTTFRSFEDRMFDEFIWNRNRQLKKAWVDIDYGMFVQDVLGGDHADGNRFSISGGFDWQESNTLQLGLTGRVVHTASKTSDAMDLSYADVVEMGHVSIDVTDTNIGLGGYLMKTLGDKARVYGNAFLDIHVLDVNRNQNFVGAIDGDGVAFSLISEWGLMHDILNQYIVGNIYARAGYNFGFDITEKVSGDDYMKIESDGYLVLTPGYSLIAQKRIYPSAWFQIRPYASIGIEYDLLGAPDSLDYKFVGANSFTKYDIDINPMWANIGGGVELLSAHGIQLGVDYRYQYNSAIQLHNIKISGSYRF